MNGENGRFPLVELVETHCLRQAQAVIGSQRTDRVNIHQPAARDGKIGQEPGRVGGADDDLPTVTAVHHTLHLTTKIALSKL
jgi:hypothetical protein